MAYISFDEKKKKNFLLFTEPKDVTETGVFAQNTWFSDTGA